MLCAHDAVLDGDEEDMVDRVKEALDYKALQSYDGNW